MSEAPRSLFSDDAAGAVRPAAWRIAHPPLRSRPLFADDPRQGEQQAEQDAEERRRSLAVAAEAQQERARAEGALRAGYEGGYASGRRAAAADYQARLQEVAGSIAALAQLRGELQAGSERQVVDLALHVAEQLLLEDVQARRAFTERMVQQALALLREAEHVTLRVGADDLSALRSACPELVETTGVRLVADASVALGGVIADSALGRVDATLDARLAAMRARLAAGPA